jgi:L-alanine-DL-glutamate epimerase-like enolase superfamily enzyme
MKITRVETWTVPVRQEVPYAVAYGEYDASDLVFLRIETDAGLTGFGSAGCDPDVTGETAATVATALRQVAEPLLRGADADHPLRLIDQVKGAIGRQPSALAAVDMALFDLLGRHREQPLWRLLGAARDRIPTSITIGILPEEETVDAAVQWLLRGFFCLKVKGGLDVEADIARVIRVREAVGDGVELRFDANQGYTVDQSLRFAREARPARLAFIEQPTSARQPGLLGTVRQAKLLPVMADECVHDAANAGDLAERGLADLLNVKLMKTGGIAGAQRVHQVGLPIMVGCMDESALGIAAGLHFALGVGAEYADLDGHIGLAGDPAAPALMPVNGVLYPPDGPGLGIDLQD